MFFRCWSYTSRGSTVMNYLSFLPSIYSLVSVRTSKELRSHSQLSLSISLIIAQLSDWFGVDWVHQVPISIIFSVHHLGYILMVGLGPSNNPDQQLTTVITTDLVAGPWLVKLNIPTAWYGRVHFAHWFGSGSELANQMWPTTGPVVGHLWPSIGLP